MPKNKMIAALITLLISGLLFSSGCARGEEGEVGFETLAQGFDSQIQEKCNFVLENEQELELIWHRAGQNSPPEVDFDEYKVIAVFSGEQPTGGYEIEVERIAETEGSLRVYIQETSPDPSDMVTQALTYPYHIVRVAAIEKEVEFIYQ